jgi:hypothetical protein
MTESSPSSQSPLIQVVFAINAATGNIEGVEQIDPAGKRRELSEAECALLAAGRPDSVDDLLELADLLSP